MSVSYVLVKKSKPEIYDLDNGLWRGLDVNPKHVPFTMADRGWTVPKLTALINTVLYLRDAEPLAKDILDWAGSDEVILIDNRLPYTEVTRRRFKFSSAKHKVVRNRWAVYQTAITNA